MNDLISIFDSRFYFSNPHSIAPFLVASVSLILGSFIHRLELKSQFTRTLLYFYVSSAMWLYGCGLILNSKLALTAFFWAHIFYIGLILTPATMFHISVIATKRFPRQRHFVVFIYVIAFLLMLMTRNAAFLQGVKYSFLGFYPRAGILQLVLFYFIVLCFILSYLNIFNYYLREKDPTERRKIRFFTMAFSVAALAFVDILPTYDLNIYPFGYIAILGFVLSMTCYNIKSYYVTIQQRAEKLESEVNLKGQEISKIVEELRTTQLKLLETGKISALASLSAGILHQISQPITAIHGFLRFIKKEMKPDDTFYKPICLMEEQSVYLKEMLEDLMELIRHREIKKERIDVNVSIQRAVNLLTDELRIRRVDWDLILTEDLPQVYADAVHLQQIFMNVLINAIQAMAELPRGSKRYIKVTSEFAQHKNQVVISFQDSGPGLTVDDQKQIFEPFFSTKTKGAGIGLALCKDLIAEHGGNIDVESQPNAGANFIIRLPSAESLASAKLGVQRI